MRLAPPRWRFDSLRSRWRFDSLRSRWRFRSLRSRLSVLYAGLFAGALILVALTTQWIVERTARASVVADLSASAAVYDRLWRLREQALADSGAVLARDFGFRSAVASNDRATIASALDTLRDRARVTRAMVVTVDGTVIGADGALAASVAHLPEPGAGAVRDGVMQVGDTTWRAVVVPILAPDEIGWLVFVMRLDATEMRALATLSSIPLVATILHRTPDHGWTSADGGLTLGAPVEAMLAKERGHGLTTLSLPQGTAFATVKPLAGMSGGVAAVLLLTYPYDLAFAPFRPLQWGIALAGVLALVVVIVATGRLTRRIVRPIAALDAAARALEAGDRTEVAIESEDEIGRLADSFNRMSSGIVERENRIAHLAFHDSLTGLPNRVSLRQMLEQKVERAARTGTQVGVMCLDLDGFKGVNDTLGHPVGDAVLVSFAQLLLATASDAFVARLGGDEFAIVFLDAQAGERARSWSRALMERMAEPFDAGDHQLAIGTSIGIALYPGDGGDAEQLLKNADLALYRAKQEGRSNFRFFEPALDEAARKRHEMELDLRTALKTRQFRLVFQPIVDLKSGRVGCFESLLRWHHPVRGLVSPADFVPIAEETGLIVAIGEWVMHEACRVAAAWPDHVRVAVNVSPLQFRNPGFQAIVLQALARSGLAPKRLEVEITESIFIDGEENVTSVLHRLRAMGVRVALDDFGTGYSSLSYLRSFPFDKIKIDRSFVTGIAGDRGATAIVRAIVDLANALDMETTAEGVEDDAQLASLRRQGCSSIQGFLFSRPLEEDDAAAYVRAAIVHAA
ncbi:putative bifunctional diguanylate cyclase/phosphodiesterase [Sphingomonas adhaesiva]|uniref:putative bifunctional diguanylate cyclase/phosphodiesterase n=1 Tax=Sphingomonas adhaesiva TaxID=28212 RepID=UPI002FFB4F13